MSVSLLKPKTYLSQRKAMPFEYHTATENTGLVSLNNKTILEILLTTSATACQFANCLNTTLEYDYYHTSTMTVARQ